ncbi:MAG TPA: hypothetical protein VE262_14925 [Blastocatellia bacterium]|nr:hypothetical protein [Blastocatellia bacterium]
MSANMSSTSARTAQDKGPDMAERTARNLDTPVKNATGLSLFHWLTLGSIGASIALFAAGKKDLAIFIGLWPPTFQALKAASENKQANENF